MDLDKMNGVAAANRQEDLEQARRGQELPPSGSHGTNRLAIGHLIREVRTKNQRNELTTTDTAVNCH
jgi:hypothetical protein